MNEDDLNAHYKKKPKSILILDCVYLETQRKYYSDLAKEKEREYLRLESEFSKLRSKNAILKDAMSKLIGVIEIMRQQIGI